VSEELRAGYVKRREKPDASYHATFIAYLASDASANINGCIFDTEARTLGIWSKPEIVKQISRDWKKEGRWTFEEIERLVPKKLLVGYVNPAPRQPEDK
jgi:hypothetical protein